MLASAYDCKSVADQRSISPFRSGRCTHHEMYYSGHLRELLLKNGVALPPLTPKASAAARGEPMVVELDDDDERTKPEASGSSRQPGGCPLFRPGAILMSGQQAASPKEQRAAPPSDQGAALSDGQRAALQSLQPTSLPSGRQAAPPSSLQIASLGDWRAAPLSNLRAAPPSGRRATPRSHPWTAPPSEPGAAHPRRRRRAATPLPDARLRVPPTIPPPPPAPSLWTPDGQP
jgi:hypothetical protein